MNTVSMRQRGRGHERERERERVQRDAERALFNLLIYWQKKYDHLTVAEILYILESVVSSIMMTLLKKIVD